jgi:hypothetical protein
MFPRWVYFAIAVWAVLAVSLAVFTFKECGAKALLLGNGAGAAAFMGMCDE